MFRVAGRDAKTGPDYRPAWPPCLDRLSVPKIKAYYEEVLADFSIGDMAHTLHYFLKLLDIRCLRWQRGGRCRTLLASGEARLRGHTAESQSITHGLPHRR